jgi:hypothetical protein
LPPFPASRWVLSMRRELRSGFAVWDGMDMYG